MLIRITDKEEYNALLAEYNMSLIEELIRALRKYPTHPKRLKLGQGLYFDVDTRELLVNLKERWKIDGKRNYR